jgi:Tfp pilus assembly protein PilX
MSRQRGTPRQRGVVLVVALLLLLVTTLLLFSSVQNALQEQKAARAFRDRAVAFEAAEAGLADAEADIEASPSSTRSRSALFVAGRSDGFPTTDMPLCRHGRASRLQGLCRAAQRDELLSLLAQEVAADGIDSGVDEIAVEYGRFTGRTLQTGGGMLPARPPRYVIELVRDRAVERALEQETQQEPAVETVAEPSADTANRTAQGNANSSANSTASSLYRITAIGFGPQPEVQVVLQSFYRKV